MMIHIEKNFSAPEVVAYKKELRENQMDKDSLSDETIHPTLMGPDVYDVVKSFPTFQGLKRRMFAEQGGICCYCGCRLEYPTHPQHIIEHVFPKEKDRTLAGEYENLLLSCKPTAEEERNRMAAHKKVRKNFFHCDKAKGSKVISITPLQQNCQDFFVYDEFGGIDGIDETSKDIVKKILNLDCKWLHDRREAAIEGAIYDEDGNILPDEELRQRLSTVMNTDEDGKHTEFCFVIQKVIEKLLSK